MTTTALESNRSEGWVYAAVATGKDGSLAVIGTCVVPAGAAAFAVSFGDPSARVVKVPPESATLIGNLIAARATELTDEERAEIVAACGRALAPPKPVARKYKCGCERHLALEHDEAFGA